MENKEIDIDDYLEIRSANDWLRSAKAVPVPKMLFGEMWFEGEIAIMFGDTGVGKSSLAVQIGEAVAREKGRVSSHSARAKSVTTPSAQSGVHPSLDKEGRPTLSSPPVLGGVAAASADGVVNNAAPKNFGFGTVTARPQTVLYLDFELSAKQFEMRYAAEHEAGRGDHLKNHYRFSDRLKRIAIKPDVFRQDGDSPFESAVRRLIEPLIERTGARVLIVDNITYLKRTADNSRDAAPLMKELKRLKEQFGLSILVIAHTPKRDVKRPLVLNDMQGSKVIANFADSVFAIGQSHRESNERYIKHLKQRSSEMLHGRGALPVFRMGKLGGNFLGLEFRRYAAESELLRESADSHAWATIQKAKELSDAGLTIRQIAEQLGLSKSAAHRYLQMWHPSLSSPPALGVVDAASADPPVENFYFPGREEYDEASDDPRFDELFDDESPGNDLLSHEAYLIEAACARARQAYIETGIAPPLNDDPAYREFKSEAEAAAGVFLSSEIQDSRSWIPNPGSETENPHSALRSPQSVNPLDLMEVVIDDYGRERFVESRYENGKLRVWYQHRSDGALLRHEHRGFGSFSELADPEVFGSFQLNSPPG